MDDSADTSGASSKPSSRDAATVEMRVLLESLVGQPLMMPGGKGQPFQIIDVGATTVRVKNGPNIVSVPLPWFAGSWSRLASAKLLTRGTMPAEAKYRSGHIFSVLARHPRVVVVNPFPTKLAIRE